MRLFSFIEIQGRDDREIAISKIKLTISGSYISLEVYFIAIILSCALVSLYDRLYAFSLLLE